MEHRVVVLPGHATFTVTGTETTSFMYFDKPSTPKFGSTALSTAYSPAMCGAAIEVPTKFPVCVGDEELEIEDRIPLPTGGFLVFCPPGASQNCSSGKALGFARFAVGWRVLPMPSLIMKDLTLLTPAHPASII